MHVDQSDVGCALCCTLNGMNRTFPPWSHCLSEKRQRGILWMRRMYGVILPCVSCKGNCIWPQSKVLPIIWVWGIVLLHWCSFISCTNEHLERITGTEYKHISFLYSLRTELPVWISAHSFRYTLLSCFGFTLVSDKRFRWIKDTFIHPCPLVWLPQCQCVRQATWHRLVTTWRREVIWSNHYLIALPQQAF